MIEYILKTLFFRIGYDTIKRFLSTENSNLNDKMRNSVNCAIEKFKDKHKFNYGSVNDNFLASQSNFDKFIESIDFDTPKLTSDRINRNGFGDTPNVPLDALEDFFNLLKEEIKKDGELHILISIKDLKENFNDLVENYASKTLLNTETIIEKLEAFKTFQERVEKFIVNPELKGISKDYLEGNDIRVGTVEPITDEEVIIKMGEQIITKVNELIEKNELEAALKILEGLISASDFNNINAELRINILATKGAVFIRSLDKENAGKIFEELQKFNISNKRKWNYIFKYGTICSSDQLITEALEELKKLGVSKDELTIKKTSYYLARGKTDDIIALLEEGGVEEND
jgi:hypothetical protein